MVWDWDANAEKAFAELRDLLVNFPVLKYYSVERTVVLSVGASQNRLGCALLQDGLQVAYASKALVMESFPISLDKKVMFQHEIVSDEEIQCLKRFILQRWPDKNSWYLI